MSMCWERCALSAPDTCQTRAHTVSGGLNPSLTPPFNPQLLRLTLEAGSTPCKGGGGTGAGAGRWIPDACASACKHGACMRGAANWVLSAAGGFLAWGGVIYIVPRTMRRGHQTRISMLSLTARQDSTVLYQSGHFSTCYPTSSLSTILAVGKMPCSGAVCSKLDVIGW